MDTRADVIRLCMGLPDSYEDYPFDDPNWTAMRHKTNHKTYAQAQADDLYVRGRLGGTASG